MLVWSAQNEICAVGVAVAAGIGVRVAMGVTKIGGTATGGAGSITGTSATLRARTKSADTQPMPLGAEGIETAHQVPAGLRPTISPSSPKSCKAQDRVVGAGAGANVDAIGGRDATRGHWPVPAAGSGRSTVRRGAKWTAVSPLAARSTIRLPSMP